MSKHVLRTNPKNCKGAKTFFILLFICHILEYPWEYFKWLTFSQAAFFLCFEMITFRHFLFSITSIMNSISKYVIFKILNLSNPEDRSWKSSMEDDFRDNSYWNCSWKERAIITTATKKTKKDTDTGDIGWESQIVLVQRSWVLDGIPSVTVH